MTGIFLDTMIVCTVTDPVIVMSVLYLQIGIQESVTILLYLVSCSTIIGGFYYDEKCFDYIFGDRNTIYYRMVFCIVVILCAGHTIQLVWDIADIFNALMAISSLIALCQLPSVIVSETNKFKEIRK